MALKYLRYDSDIFLFDIVTSHTSMHEAVGFGRTPTSAGTCAVWPVNDEMEVSADGGSVTLNVKSLPDDAELIRRRLQLY